MAIAPTTPTTAAIGNGFERRTVGKGNGSVDDLVSKLEAESWMRRQKRRRREIWSSNLNVGVTVVGSMPNRVINSGGSPSMTTDTLQPGPEDTWPCNVTEVPEQNYEQQKKARKVNGTVVEKVVQEDLLDCRVLFYNDRFGGGPSIPNQNFNEQERSGRPSEMLFTKAAAHGLYWTRASRSLTMMLMLFVGDKTEQDGLYHGHRPLATRQWIQPRQAVTQQMIMAGRQGSE
ncbi:hypothetical protein DFH07DRAFT_784281 [Mycena maculata]|uniref:Uncharacterized protein n=1 Tax=Mycena maculata TaxID=230809 RepID=A0AAD7MJU8_9AGAR|nr:hypothetical protein DFH07DRAFT_784281 [Mycena maculata]